MPRYNVKKPNPGENPFIQGKECEVYIDCAYESCCLNNNKCFRCSNHSLLKIKGQKGQQKTAGLLNSHNVKTAQADNSWEDLEQQVADKLNDIPTITEARRSRASGAKIFKPLAPILVKVCPVCYYK